MANKKYTEEFKLDAVKLILEKGYTYKEAAKRLKVHKDTLARWVRIFEAGDMPGTDGKTPKEVLEELKRLRKENKKLRIEQEILKKAAAFFAKEVK